MQVVLTDCEEAVLLNLRECAAANAEPRQAPGQSARADAFLLQVSPLMPCPTDSLAICECTARVLNCGTDVTSHPPRRLP